MGQYDQCLAGTRRPKELSPTYSPVYFNTMNRAMVLNRLLEAREAYQEALVQNVATR
jgi:hypothetical protein